jgi:predicted RNase H-like nuclease (RuvC/YqgF family)
MDLLKEAIAEAKAIREVAIENAKASLAETFAPQIKNMISNRLSEGDLFEEDELEDETPEEVDEEMVYEVEDDETDLEEEFFAEAEEGDEDLFGEAEDPDDMYTEADNYSDDLDEIISELEGEVDDLDEEEEMEDEPVLAPKKEGYGKEEKSIEEYINELIREMSGEEEEEEMTEAEDEKVKELQTELDEAYKTIKFLRSKMNEALLINSKLLYSGKIFRSHNLDESQKVSILETFDRAKNIRETKLLYASLSTTLKEVKAQSKSNKVSRLKESRASKATLNTTKPAREKILEENKIVSRLQQLAGII